MFSQEFRNNKVLQAALGALVFAYFVVFYSWIGNSVITRQAVEGLDYVCPRYYQNCEWLYVLQALPHGYSQTILYMGLFATLLGVVYLMVEKKWHSAQIFLLIPFFWHTVNVFVLTDYFSGNYEYYLFIFGVVLLFLPHKEFFLKLSLVVFYALSTVSKLHPAWIEGGYFNHLQSGLPIFPDWSIPLWTNLVILMEMIGSWFLLSRHFFIQRTVLIFFVFFHVYSGFIVEYRYPATVLPMLIVVFGPWYRYTPVPLDKKSLIGWFMIVMLFVFQFLPKFIHGDEKLTLEGNKYGLYMFESNHQCISEATLHFADGSNRTSIDINKNARNRCDPYKWWFFYSKLCSIDEEIERIAWTLDHSINGSPFYRVVDAYNVCSLDYRPFTHNMWIKTEKDQPEIIGWPVKNYFH